MVESGPGTPEVGGIDSAPEPVPGPGLLHRGGCQVVLRSDDRTEDHPRAPPDRAAHAPLRRERCRQELAPPGGGRSPSARARGAKHRRQPDPEVRPGGVQCMEGRPRLGSDLRDRATDPPVQAGDKWLSAYANRFWRRAGRRDHHDGRRARRDACDHPGSVRRALQLSPEREPPGPLGRRTGAVRQLVRRAGQLSDCRARGRLRRAWRSVQWARQQRLQQLSAPRVPDSRGGARRDREAGRDLQR